LATSDSGLVFDFISSLLVKNMGVWLFEKHVPPRKSESPKGE
jgi:hypothetical protein